MEIVNRDANFRSDICQRVNSEKAICSVIKDYVSMLCDVFEELKKGKDIKIAVSNIRERNLAKKRRKWWICSYYWGYCFRNTWDRHANIYGC